MDPVSRVLEERERRLPRLGPFAVLAIVMHAAAAGAVYLAARADSGRPAHLPSVSVRLVQPPRPTAQDRRAAGPQSPQKVQPTAAPRPAAAPTPKPAAPTPVPQPTSPALPPSSEAMSAPASNATPVPTPASASPGRGGRGLSLGGDQADADESGIPSDFQFTYYVDRMLALIESRWFKPPVPPGTRARVTFVILRDGRLESIRLESSSGVPSFDRAALRAMYAANPLPPLPPAYRRDRLTIHLTFSE